MKFSFNSGCLVLTAEPEVERMHRRRGAPQVADMYRPAACSGNGKNTSNTQIFTSMTICHKSTDSQTVAVLLKLLTSTVLCFCFLPPGVSHVMLCSLAVSIHTLVLETSSCKCILLLSIFVSKSVHLLWLTLLCLLEMPHTPLICPIMKSTFVYDDFVV